MIVPAIAIIEYVNFMTVAVNFMALKKRKIKPRIVI
jgi:hypothetical protein